MIVPEKFGIEPVLSANYYIKISVFFKRYSDIHSIYYFDDIFSYNVLEVWPVDE